MSFFRVNEKCNGCLACIQNCPASALNYMDQDNRRTIMHNMSLCARCGNCWRICPQQAIEFKHILRGKWEEVVSMELVHCAVCGEPIYTARLGNSLPNNSDNISEALCPQHKKAVPLGLWKRVASGRAIGAGGEV